MFNSTLRNERDKGEFIEVISPFEPSVSFPDVSEEKRETDTSAFHFDSSLALELEVK